ncbi:MAG: YqiJ family protein [Planctomycetes bacterium]|nr:YqiJ family protein [Planctomycetota bacterium]
MLLLSLYVGGLVLGGGLLAASALMGDADHDADHDLDHDLDHDADHGGHVGAADAVWLPILSIRFWTFFLAFFGLTGLTLEGMRAVGLIGATWAVVLALALVTGAGAGWLVSRLLRGLKQEKVSSEVVPEQDYVGKAAEVLLDVAPGDPGLVRLDVKGVSIDVSAVLADDAEALRRGQKVIVLAYEQGKVKVARFETGEHEPARERRREPA